MTDGRTFQKRAIRAEIRERRRSMTQLQRDEGSAALTQQLISVVQAHNASRVSGYIALTDEPDTSGFLNWARQSAVNVLLPISREDGLLDWVVSRNVKTEPGLFNIPEAQGERLGPESVSGVDLMLIPACAVDVTGNRLGWGRGYFDRALSAMDARPLVYAVVFDHEVLDSVPTDDHDQRVDGVVTPQRVVRFG